MNEYSVFSNRTILITGGTGSFGTAFSQYLMGINCKKVIIFSRDWLKQKTLREKLGDPVNYRWFIGDIRDKERLKRALEEVDYCIHAGAIKDLPTCENEPYETMQTNIVGTQNVIDACIYNNVARCLFISSDKAVFPCNAYGVSKAMGESLWLNGNNYTGMRRSEFAVARYGNVVGSNGSIVPVFKKFIEDGIEKLPVTDTRMTRFWFDMTDVMQFVDDCFCKLKAREIYTPDLPSVLITDVCKAFGKGFETVGIRNGEKLHETMGKHDEKGNLIDSGNNKWFLSVEEIKKSLRKCGCNV